MSRDLYLLGARLRAASTRRAVAVAAYAPVPEPVEPVAVVAVAEGRHVHLDASDGTTRRSGTDRDALAALDALGVSTASAAHRTLVCATPATVALLASLARAYPDAACAPVLAWWDQRVDHPGTSAVLCVVQTARARWVLGETPEAERELETWARWLGVAQDGPDGLLALARQVSAGPVLPGLDEAAQADVHSWSRLRDRMDQGRSWQRLDTRADAALGLAARSHAAEQYASLRLDDPLVARAGVWDGSVVAGTVVHRSRTALVVRADRPVSRLRVDAEVTGWPGEPVAPDVARAGTGRVTGTAVSADGALTLTIGSLVARGLADAPVGGRVTLRPARIDPFMHGRGRGKQAAALYRTGNWIAGRGAPIRRRGDVPLDVVIAAADT